MVNNISAIPHALSSKCPNLSALILSNNPLSEIPESFFLGMLGLKVLDLSCSKIKALPGSISKLENLSALRSNSCHNLKYVPSLENLRALKKLDLHRAGFEVVTQGVEMLVNLEYLELLCPLLKEIPTGILSNLLCLQYLVVHAESATARDFIYFVNKSKDFQSPPTYRLVLGTDNEDLISQKYSSESKNLLLISHWEIRGECLVLPKNLEEVQIRQCKNLRSLSQTTLLEKATELSWCGIWNWEEVECVLDLVSSSSLRCPILEKLEKLQLYLLPNLHALVKVDRVPTPLHIFSNLKLLFIVECSKIKMLFPLELLQNLQNIEAIEFRYCEQMEEIIASDAPVKFTFPKLTELQLSDLPQLKSICNAKGVVVIDSIEIIEIKRCTKLKRIPVELLQLDNGEPSLPPRLKKNQNRKCVKRMVGITGVG